VESVNTERVGLLLLLVMRVGSTAAFALQWEFDHSVGNLCAGGAACVDGVGHGSF
jgi:hypothetical protein